MNRKLKQPTTSKETKIAIKIKLGFKKIRILKAKDVRVFIWLQAMCLNEVNKLIIKDYIKRSILHISKDIILSKIQIMLSVKHHLQVIRTD